MTVFQQMSKVNAHNYLPITAVYGGLDLHGRQRSPVQTYLAATAAAGDDSITVSSDVDWVVSSQCQG